MATFPQGEVIVSYNVDQKFKMKVLDRFAGGYGGTNFEEGWITPFNKFGYWGCLEVDSPQTLVAAIHGVDNASNGYDGEYNDEWLNSELLTADDEVDFDFNEYRWKELRLTGKDGEPFYYFNSEMYRLFFRSKKIIGEYSRVDAVHTREPETETSNTSKTKKKTEETSCDLTPKESREEYLRLLNVNTKVIDKESTTILKYYKSMYSVLTHEYFNLDKKLIGDILDNTLTGLLKRQLNLSINTALSKFEHITIEDLAKICGSSKEALNNQLYQLENTMLPMQHLYLISTVLGVPSSQLLGITPPPSTIPTDEVDAKDK